MGEWHGRQFSYDFEDVAKLMGLREGRGNTGIRHATVIDLISLARDPGGPVYRRDLAYDIEEDDRGRRKRKPVGDPQAWMGRRGPLDMHSNSALVLWDFMRATRTLPLREQGIVALLAFGFTQRDIADLLSMNQAQVSRTIWGRRQEPGVVSRMHRAMNGGRDG